MKKNYITPEVLIIEEEPESLMLDTSILYGGEVDGVGVSVAAKGGIFDFEEENEDESVEFFLPCY